MGTPTIKRVQVEPPLGLTLPQPQIIGILSVIPGNNHVVSDSENFLTTTPDGFAFFDAFGVPVEANLVGNIKSRQLPRVIVLEPRIWCLQLTIKR